MLDTRKMQAKRRDNRRLSKRILEEKLKLLAELTPFIARSIGRNCEVVLHDNRAAPARILAIANAEVTKRQVGDFMTRISIADVEVDELREPLFNYASAAPDGTELRVSLLPIDHEGRTVAYFAINFATSELNLAQRIIAQLTRTEPHPEEIRETFLPAAAPLSQAIDECLDGLARPAHLLGRDERVSVVRRLHERGVFRLRGAASTIAARLGISRAAVYNYLKTIQQSP